MQPGNKIDERCTCGHLRSQHILGAQGKYTAPGKGRCILCKCDKYEEDKKK